MEKPGSRCTRIWQLTLSAIMLCGLAACSGQKTGGVTTAEQFVSDFIAALDSGNGDAIASRIKWGNVPENYRPALLRSILLFARSGKVSKVGCSPYTQEIGDRIFKDSHFVGTPEYWLHVEFKGERFSGHLDFAFARDHGRFYVLADWPSDKTEGPAR